MSRRLSAFSLLTIIVLISLIYYFKIIKPQQKYYQAHHVKIHGVYLINPIQIKDFQLIDNHGKKFNKDSLKGHWTMAYFGFTHCEFICPTVMANLSKTYTVLQNNLAQKDLPHVIFVTVDPERDSIEVLNNFISHFHPLFIGIRGNLRDTLEIQNQFHILAKKTAPNNQDIDSYSLDHTADIVLINPAAEIQAYFTYPQLSENLVKDFLLILKKI